MICEFIDNQCSVCGWTVPERLRGRSIFRQCGKQETVQAEPVQIPEPTSCVHRGELLRVEVCKPCQSGGRVPEVFSCAVHGECTLYRINKRKPDGSVWKSCLSCESFSQECLLNSDYGVPPFAS